MNTSFKTKKGEEFSVEFHPDTDTSITIVESEYYSEVKMDLTQALSDEYSGKNLSGVSSGIQKGLLEANFEDSKSIIQKISDNVPPQAVEISTTIDDVDGIANLVPFPCDNFKLSSVSTGRELSFDGINIGFKDSQGKEYVLTQESVTEIPYSDRVVLGQAIENIESNGIEIDTCNLKQNIEFENLKDTKGIKRPEDFDII